MDSVRTDTNLTPVKTQSGGLITYCNLNVYRVVQALGLNLFYNFDADRPMLANEMVTYMDIFPQRFSRFQNHVIAHELVNKGFLILAGQKEELHGHITPLYPSAGMKTSGKWRTQVPYVSNVGERNEIMGLNFAFADLPDYYIIL